VSAADCSNPAVTLGKTFYYYDGEERRVGKVSGAVTQVFVYDARGQLAAEYGGSVEVSGTHYVTADHLGSTRVITDASKAVLMCKDYLPFGDEILASSQNARSGIACYSGETGLRQKFTGKERDSESRLDYFGARYFSWAAGRFNSPDEPLADQIPEDPRSWNLYVYTRNNPLALVDTDGNFVATVTGALAGGVIGGTIELYRGGSFLKGAATGAFSGAIAGSVIDTGGTSLGVLALAGATGGVGGGVLDRSLNGQATGIQDVAVDATVGAAAGVAGAALGKAAVAIGQRIAGPSAAFETLQPGPYAGGSVAAGGRGISAAERQAVNEAGAHTGCHTCGAKVPGTKSGNWVGDHQPPSGSLHTSGTQSLYPQCATCSARQGAQVRLQNQQWQNQQRIGAATGAGAGSAVRKRRDDEE